MDSEEFSIHLKAASGIADASDSAATCPGRQTRFLFFPTLQRVATLLVQRISLLGCRAAEVVALSHRMPCQATLALATDWFRPLLESSWPVQDCCRRFRYGRALSTQDYICIDVKHSWTVSSKYFVPKCCTCKDVRSRARRYICTCSYFKTRSGLRGCNMQALARIIEAVGSRGLLLWKPHPTYVEPHNFHKHVMRDRTALDPPEANPGAWPW